LALLRGERLQVRLHERGHVGIVSVGQARDEAPLFPDDFGHAPVDRLHIDFDRVRRA
jgi:hypothetical protein